jgi:hypothetical protein
MVQWTSSCGIIETLTCEVPQTGDVKLANLFPLLSFVELSRIQMRFVFSVTYVAFFTVCGVLAIGNMASNQTPSLKSLNFEILRTALQQNFHQPQARFQNFYASIRRKILLAN